MNSFHQGIFFTTRLWVQPESSNTTEEYKIQKIFHAIIFTYSYNVIWVNSNLYLVKIKTISHGCFMKTFPNKFNIFTNSIIIKAFTNIIINF